MRIASTATETSTATSQKLEFGSYLGGQFQQQASISHSMVDTAATGGDASARRLLETDADTDAQSARSGSGASRTLQQANNNNNYAYARLLHESPRCVASRSRRAALPGNGDGRFVCVGRRSRSIRRRRSSRVHCPPTAR